MVFLKLKSSSKNIQNGGQYLVGTFRIESTSFTEHAYMHVVIDLYRGKKKKKRRSSCILAETANVSQVAAGSS